jgi:hypothetical protein
MSNLDFPDVSEFEGFSEEEAERMLNAEILRIQNLSPETINLEDEIIERYKQALLILEAAHKEPVGQRASMLRVTTDILKDLVKTKTALYNAERLIVLENTLISVLQDFPDMKAEFIRRYELALTPKEKNGR